MVVRFSLFALLRMDLFLEFHELGEPAVNNVCSVHWFVYSVVQTQLANRDVSITDAVFTTTSINMYYELHFISESNFSSVCIYLFGVEVSMHYV